jgi:lysophospholipase L1-like esterase
MRSIRKKKRLGISLALVISSLFLAVLFIEIFLSLKSLHFIGPYKQGSFVCNSSEFLYKKTIDKYGFRFADFNFDRATFNENILLIGDSFVHGTGVPDNETFAWLLNKKFNQKNIQFYNAGAGGTHLKNYYDRIRIINQRFNVKFSRIFIFIYMTNDILNYESLANLSKNINELTLYDYVKKPIEIVFPNTYDLLKTAKHQYHLDKYKKKYGDIVYKVNPVDDYIDWINRNNAYFGRHADLSDEEKKIVKERYQNFDKRIRKGFESGKDSIWGYMFFALPNYYSNLIYNMDSKEDKRSFESSMSMIDKIIQNNNTQKITLFLIPDRFQISDKFRQRVKSINVNFPKDELENLFSINEHISSYIGNKWGSKVDIVDLTPKFVATQKVDEFYFDIDIHFNSQGYELVADIVSDYLLKIR